MTQEQTKLIKSSLIWLEGIIKFEGVQPPQNGAMPEDCYKNLTYDEKNVIFTCLHALYGLITAQKDGGKEA